MLRRAHLIIAVLWPGMLAVAVITGITVVARAASKGTVSGTVKDAGTGEVLENATIMVSELGLGAIADAEGKFLLKSIPAGTYTLRTRLVGYTSSEDTLTVIAGEVVVLEVHLFPEPIPMEPVEVRAPRTVRQRTGDATHAAEFYTYRYGTSRADLSDKEGDRLSLTARAIRDRQYKLARSYAVEIGYEVEQYTDPDRNREYVILQEKGEPVKGWGAFLYYPDHRFVDVIVHRITPDFAGPMVQEIVSSVFEELGARALLICGPETVGRGTEERSPFKCVLDEWSDEETLLVQIVGTEGGLGGGPDTTRVAEEEGRMEEAERRRQEAVRGRRAAGSSLGTQVLIADNRVHREGEEEYLFPDLVWDALYAFRDVGFDIREAFREEKFDTSVVSSKAWRADLRKGFAGEYARKVEKRERISLGEERRTVLGLSTYVLDVSSFGVVVKGRALRRSTQGLLDVRMIKDALTKLLIRRALSGLEAEEIADATERFRRARPKLNKYQTPNVVKQLLDPTLPPYLRQEIMEDLLHAGVASVAPLVEALVEADEEPYVRENAMELLAGIGAPSVNALISVLRSRDEDVRRRAAWALRQIGDERAAYPLMGLLEDRHQEIRTEAVLGLGTARSRDAVPPSS